MTKQELIERIYRKRGMQNGLTKKAVADIIDGVFAELGDYFVKALCDGNPEEEARALRAHAGVAIWPTGEPIRIPAIETVAFAIGSDLRSLLNDRRNK